MVDQVLLNYSCHVANLLSKIYPHHDHVPGSGDPVGFPVGGRVFREQTLHPENGFIIFGGEA